MRIPHNQQFGRAWLMILVPYAYHDNWSVLDEQYLFIPGL